MAASDFKCLALAFLLLATLFAHNQASRDKSEFGETIFSGSKIDIGGCRPRDCHNIGHCWCCIYQNQVAALTPGGCVKEKSECLSKCHKPPQRD
ncbi:hypothetical protein MKW94_027301 [Papaver nudicaule]|uniref:Uncharacterized protein n=1 Tax=Papaver nudicaule TaxID=74823 RepID=A0AA41S6S9_PAPNU|nr:hypothetical protein [Papaver nudicaule]